jgi:hypothetical protein
MMSTKNFDFNDINDGYKCVSNSEHKHVCNRKWEDPLEVPRSIGGKYHGKPEPHSENKLPVLSLLQRGEKVRSFHVLHVTGKNLTGGDSENVNSDVHMIV